MDGNTVGKKVVLHIKMPIKLFNYDTITFDEVPAGHHPATWIENPYAGRTSPFLCLDGTSLGGVEEYWSDPISKGLVSIEDAS